MRFVWEVIVLTRCWENIELFLHLHIFVQIFKVWMKLLVLRSGEILGHDSVGFRILTLANWVDWRNKVTLFRDSLVYCFIPWFLASNINTISTILHTFKQLIFNLDSLSWLNRECTQSTGSQIVSSGLSNHIVYWRCVRSLAVILLHI